MNPLDGIRVIEAAGLAPAAYAWMLMADLGAESVVVEQLPKSDEEVHRIMPENPFEFGKRGIRANLKRKTGAETIKVIRRYYELIQSYRPGVMEFFGRGREEVLSLNPRFICARFRGWGQKNSVAGRAGHDIDFIALSGTPLY